MNNRDLTPLGFKINEDNLKEKLKKSLRHLIYPLYTYFLNIFAKRIIMKDKLNLFDKIYLNQRGNSYSFHRKRINKYYPIKGKTILILGVGTGNDLMSYVKYKPKKIICIDFFNYSKAWTQWVNLLNKFKIEIEFHQGEIENMDFIKSDSIDIVSSDAVFEHLKNFNSCLEEIYRVIKKGGLLYSTFGPLYYTFGGDHISGNDSLKNGYNHLMLSEVQYKLYLNSFGEFNHDENDGRTWINNDQFSKLKPFDYLDNLNVCGFKREFVSGIIEEKAIEFSKKFDKKFKLLLKSHPYLALIITGMTIIYKK